MKDLILTIFALLTGGSIQRLHSTGEIRILLKWPNCIISLFVVSISTFLIISNSAHFISWHNRVKDPYDEENIFLPFTSHRVPTKWRRYINNHTPSGAITSPFSSSWKQPHSSQLYYPRYCPYVFKPHYSQKSCAKPIPSFIFAGSEFSGSEIVFNLLKEYHPQISSNSIDNSYASKQHQHPSNSSKYRGNIARNTHDANHRGLFTNEDDDDDFFSEANAFDIYMSRFPFLQQPSPTAKAEEEEEVSTGEDEMHVNSKPEQKHDKSETSSDDEENRLTGEHAPQYLYHSYVTAKRIKDILPHIKAVFILRDPISRAYAQYLSDKKIMEENGHSALSNSLSFENLIDLEIPILRRCGHTSTQTGWRGFVHCHKGSEIRASWKVLSASSTNLNHHQHVDNNSNNGDTYAFNMLAKGMYYPSLIPYLQHFPSSQLFIMTIEDIVQQPMLSLQKLADFLNIDASHFIANQHIIRSQLQLYLSQQQEKEQEGLSLSTRYRLQKVYRHLNDQLFELFDNEGVNNNILSQNKGWVYDVDRG